MMSGGALSGICVLDFSTMLPGPLATLMMADAGSEVIKVEQLTGEAGRGDPAVFSILNRGKRSVAIDLKKDGRRIRKLVARCDVLVEQFRPGVMDRLGLGEAAVRAINPHIIYVSINGYGSEGPDALRPGHDLTYAAESGLLSLNADACGDPVIPAALTADIAGGSYAALTNILMALYQRERTGEGARLDIAMFAGTLPFLSEALAHVWQGRPPVPGYSPSTGSSERYNLYRTADGRHLAVACPEEKFWINFCRIVKLPLDTDRTAVAQRLAEQSSDHWLALFDGQEVCCSLVVSVSEAVETARMRKVLSTSPGALPTTVSQSLRTADPLAASPALGEANELLA